jgi:hypothetical protein
VPAKPACCARRMCTEQSTFPDAHPGEQAIPATGFWRAEHAAGAVAGAGVHGRIAGNWHCIRFACPASNPGRQPGTRHPVLSGAAIHAMEAVACAGGCVHPGSARNRCAARVLLPHAARAGYLTAGHWRSANRCGSSRSSQQCCSHRPSGCMGCYSDSYPCHTSHNLHRLFHAALFRGECRLLVCSETISPHVLLQQQTRYRSCPRKPP